MRISALLIITPAAASDTPSQMNREELEDWFNGNSASSVNEGTLTFLNTPPSKPIHHHQNNISITPESLSTGWVQLEQCHDNLDAVPQAQITFRDGFVRNLRVLEKRFIDRAWVENSSVQLAGISPGARLCLAAETQAMKKMGHGYHNLNNGPYMRKFLDGYYPMRVSIKVSYPDKSLQIIDISPAAQQGFDIRQTPGQVSLDALFEGELRTLIQFIEIH